MNRFFNFYIDAYSGFSKELWLLSLITLINKSGSMVMLFMSIYLSNSLGFSFKEIGVVMACFGVGSILGAFIGGVLTDKIGYYKVMFFSLLFAGIGFLSLIFFQSFWHICIAVLITSLVGDAFRPANYVAIRAYCLPENQTRGIAIIRLAINLGFAVGPAIGGLLAESFGFHWVFILDGVTCILAALTFIALLTNKKIIKKVADQSPEKSNYFSVFKNYQYLSFLACLFLISIAFFQVFTILPVYLESEFGYSESMIGMLLAINGILIIVIELPLVFAIENKFSILKLIGIGCFFMFVSYVLLGLDLKYVCIPILFMIIITVGEMLNFPFASSWALNQSNEQNAGIYMSVFSMCFSASHIIAPLLGYYLVDQFGYSAMWSIMAGLCFIAFLGIFKLEASIN